MRMFVVGERRDVPIRAEIPEDFRFLNTYAETWDWAESIVQKYPAAQAEVKQTVEVAPAPLPAPAPIKTQAPTAPEGGARLRLPLSLWSAVRFLPLLWPRPQLESRKALRLNAR